MSSRGWGTSALAGRPARVLLVEDDRGDAQLLRRALDKSRLALDLDWVADGEEALAYLRREGEYAAAPRPDLVLLDLNMPKKDGHAVLADIRADPGLTDLPVVILTTSQADEDVTLSYRLRANAYIAKPVGLQGFADVLQSIDGFWFSVVVLPVTGRRG